MVYGILRGQLINTQPFYEIRCGGEVFAGYLQDYYPSLQCLQSRPVIAMQATRLIFVNRAAPLNPVAQPASSMHF